MRKQFGNNVAVAIDDRFAWDSDVDEKFFHRTYDSGDSRGRRDIWTCLERHVMVHIPWQMFDVKNG